MKTKANKILIGTLLSVATLVGGSALVSCGGDDIPQSNSTSISTVDSEIPQSPVDELKNAKEKCLEAINTLAGSYKSEDYVATTYATITSKIEAAKNAVNALTTAEAAKAYDVNALKTELDGVTKDATVHVGKVGYATLEDALATANDVKVVLNQDIDYSEKGLKIVKDKKVTLDLNGHAAKFANGTNSINVYGEFTLEDSIGTGKLYTETFGTGYSMIYVNENAKFVMNSGNIETAAPENPVKNGAFAIYATGDNPTVIINDGTIKAGWYAVSTNGSETTNANIEVNGGKLISTMDYALYMPSTGKVKITGGDIFGAAGAIQINKGELEITGGKLSCDGTGDTGDATDGTGGTGYAVLSIRKRYGDVKIAISGGVFVGKEGAVKTIVVIQETTYTYDLTITGGTFSDDVSSFLGEGYEQKNNVVVAK